MKRRSLLGRNRNALKTGIPPYTRYSKAPYLYSAAYREWFHAATKNRKVV